MNFLWFSSHSGPRPPHCVGFKITLRRIKLGRLPRTSGQPGNTARQHTTFTTDRQPMPQVGFEPAIPASERPQTHASDHLRHRDRCS